MDFNMRYEEVKILVVDDMLENRLLLKTILSKWGFDVDEAADGEKAIECAERINYRHIFMDLNMPGVDGFEATRIIRENEKESRGPGAIISALTTYKSLDAKARCRQLGFDNFFTKPISQKDLRAVLENSI